MKSLLTYLTARLAERSTWLGIIGFASTIGITLQPQYQEAIITAGIGLASALAIVTADKTN
jgi:hypothetical protein